MRRKPRIGPWISELRELAGGDPSVDVARLLEVVLSRALGRQVFVAKIAPDVRSPLASVGGRVGTWVTKARTLDAWFRDADPRQLPHGLDCPRRQIEALVPIVIPSDTIVAMVAIGWRRLRRLSRGERSLVEAAIGMAVLLMQQAQLRHQVHAAENLAGVVERVAEAERLQRGIRSYLNASRN